MDEIFIDISLTNWNTTYMQNLNSKALTLLHKWLNDGKIPHIRKGMVEDLENFAVSAMADEQAQKIAQRMVEVEKEVAQEEPNA